MALNKQQGFSLLEAIVALVLVATTGMALLDWINTNLITLRRVSAVQQRQTAIRNALTFMELVNPLVDPKGQEKFDLFTIRWQAKPLELPKDGIS
ncbi:MAG: type II secretion system protein, partial [Pseudomonadota bacterium]|nr:type II secretion system protein [Pseudomonadota bacterium]